MLTIQSIVGFFTNHWSEIKDVLGLLFAAAAVWYGRKAYKVAKLIFHEGVKIDQSKVLTQVSVEIVTEFILPFNDFEKAVKTLWADFNRPVDMSLKISTVLEILNKHSFKVGYPYFDANKGLVWDALSDSGNKKGVKAGKLFSSHKKDVKAGKPFSSYEKIIDFISETVLFGDGIKTITDALEKYMGLDADHNAANAPKSSAPVVDRSNDTLEDFFNDKIMNAEMFRIGAQRFISVQEKIDGLPRELDIKEMLSELNTMKGKNAA